MDKKKHYLISNIKKWILLMLLSDVCLIGYLLLMAIENHSYKTILIIAVIVQIVILYIGHITVVLKYKRINKIMELYMEGYLSENLSEQNLEISPIADGVLKLLSERLDKNEILNLNKKQAQYLALQNQINPHFLYNTLESIRSEALCSGMDGVASMTEALATFFRYTISNVDHLVTLEDELTNIENYYMIQQYRFGDKLNLSIEYEDEDDGISVLNLKLPKLVLQPIVENSIYHGIEQKIGKGTLRIITEHTSNRLLIRISDDGMGMPPEVLEKLNNKLLTNALDDIMESKREKKGGIAIINVNNRIKLLFGEEYGIYMYSTKGVGTDVEITLPIIKE